MPNIDAWVKQVQSFPSHLPPKMESNNEQYIGHSHSGPPIQSRKNTLNKTKLNRLHVVFHMDKQPKLSNINFSTC